MFQILKMIFIAVFAMLLISCGSRPKAKDTSDLEKQIAKLQEQIEAAGEDAEKVTELQQKIDGLQELVDLPRKYFEELEQARKECDELAKNPNADSAAVAAAEKKLNDIISKIQNERRVIITAAWSSPIGCSYGEEKGKGEKAPQKDETSTNNIDEFGDWGTAW